MDAFYANLTSTQSDQLTALLNQIDLNEPALHALFNDFASGLSADMQANAAALYPQIAQTVYVAYTYGWRISPQGLTAAQLADMASCKITPVDQSIKQLNGQNLTYVPIFIRRYGNSIINNYAQLMLNGDSGAANLSSLTLGELVAINSRMRRSSIDNMQQPNNPIIAEVTQELGNGFNESKWLFRLSYSGTGKHHMVVVGNSHADMIAHAIASAFHWNYKRLDFFTIQGCLPFNVTYPPPVFLPEVCQAYHVAMLEMIRDVKPDIVFCNFYWDTMGQPPLTYPIEDDSILKDMQAPLDEIAKHTKLIYFSAPNLNFPNVTSIQLASRLWANTSLDSLNLPLATQMSVSNVHYVRMANLQCNKCVIVDWTKAYCSQGPEGVCQAYDPVNKLAYAYDQHHYTWWGEQQMALPFLQQLAANLTQHGPQPKKLQ
jgi:hypothetical protein